ncbi:MAG: SRPBCC family protein [Fimbriimonadaceae bacterium]|nr:SRPBCC family protein [Fimbriimonadaceae bacterium]QYK56902.1 MAG: SRPBCC family protein [Fimbriimonadaceae bacterium]
MVSIQDKIEKEILVQASAERVYRAVSTPEGIGTWFADGVEGTMNVGDQPLVDCGKYGKFRYAIVAAEPPSYFAYRWVSGSEFVPQGFEGDPLQHPNTLVEFFIDEVDEGTRVRVVESGFASLPEAYAAQNLKDNTGGWSEMLEHLRKYVDAD